MYSTERRRVRAVGRRVDGVTLGKWHVECLVLMEMEKGQKKEAVLVRVIALLEGGGVCPANRAQ